MISLIIGFICVAGLLIVNLFSTDSSTSGYIPSTCNFTVNKSFEPSSALKKSNLQMLDDEDEV